MPDPLLITKLRCPKLSAQSIARPRLTALVNDSLHGGRPLILISAPAGFGKTSLLSEWASQSSWRITWLGLDEEDNDPARFWTYFIAALQMLCEDLGQNAQAALSAREPFAPPGEPFLTVLINEISAVSEPFTLILDDYQLINTPTIHAGLTFLIDHLPVQMHLILTSRSDPPLHLARWRAGSLMAEIHADDLRFSKKECSAFLVDRMGITLSSDQVSALADRTEGWIAGLQLAALSMQGRQDITTFIADFTGSHHYIVDYLTEEVLQRQPERVQLFLLRTSILNSLCAPLCDAILENRDWRLEIRDKSPISILQSLTTSQEMLEYLERANLFLQRLDDERRWYRYHQLFAEMLRHRLRQAQPRLVLELHIHASQWYEQNGIAAEAIRHALAGEDFERAADLVEVNAAAMHWRRGEIASLYKWLEALPDELVSRRPRLSLYHAWALLISGKLEAVEARLQDVENSLAQEHHCGLDDVEIQGLRGQAAAIRARLARMRDDLPRSIELCRQALENLPPQDVFLRGVLSLNLGLAYWQSGDIAAASQVLAETSTINEPGVVPFTSLVSLAFLGDLQAEQGHLHQAARIYQQVIEGAAQANHEASPAAAWAFIGMGVVLRQWNEQEEAGRCIEKGLELAGHWGAADGLAWAYLHLAQWKAALGVPVEADGALSEAENIIRKSRVAPWTASEVSGYRGKFWISRGKIHEALHWAREHDLEAENEISYRRLPESLTFARLLLEQGRWDELDGLLDRLLRLAESSGLTGRVIEILMLQALALRAQGNTGPAGDALERAFTLAAPEGYIRLFLDEGERMKKLLQEYLRRQGPEPDGNDHTYAAGLLAILSYVEVGGARSQFQAPASGAPVEPLSERELEILRLVAEGLSNREIAQQSYISTGTVKVHLKHIFRKLEVDNRTEAAARARQLSLI